MDENCTCEIVNWLAIATVWGLWETRNKILNLYCKPCNKEYRKALKEIKP